MFSRKYPKKAFHPSQLLNDARPTYTFPLALRLKIRNEWLAGKGTFAVIAKRHGIALATLRDWSCREKWGPKRKKFMAAQKLRFETNGELPEIPTPSVNPSNSLASQIKRIETHLTKIDEAITEARTGRELRDLMMARKLAADQWANYTGFPKPGTRKQGKKSGGQSAPVFEPLDAGIQAPEEETTTTGSGAETVP